MIGFRLSAEMRSLTRMGQAVRHAVFAPLSRTASIKDRVASLWRWLAKTATDASSPLSLQRSNLSRRRNHTAMAFCMPSCPHALMPYARSRRLSLVAEPIGIITPIARGGEQDAVNPRDGRGIHSDEPRR